MTVSLKKPPFYKILYFQVLAAVVIGVLLGHFYPSLGTEMKPFGDAFIKGIKMLIAPIIFCTVVLGIAGMEDMKKVGKTGGLALLYFEIVSSIALVVGLVVVNLLQPGAGMNVDPASLDTKGIAAYTGPGKMGTTTDFLMNIIPSSAVDAFAKGEILQVLFLAILFGFALHKFGGRGTMVFDLIEKTSHVLFDMIGVIMKFAPIGVFGAIAGVFAVRDFQELAITYFKYFGSFLIGITSLWTVLILIGYIFLKSRMTILLKRIMNPLIVAFGTTSSEAVFPKLTEELERFGVKDKIVSFMLPLGYSFNLDGSMMYMTFASIFIAQAYGIDLDLGTQFTMLLVLMLTSKGIAGVPRASLVVVAANAPAKCAAIPAAAINTTAPFSSASLKRLAYSAR